MAKAEHELLTLAGREVAISNPRKVYFREAGITKLELVRYYVAVAEGALRGVAGRPMALKRYVDGAEGEFFYQKRAPEKRPDWIEVAELAFPSGRTAHEVVVRDAAHLAWVVNLGCIDLHPHPVRAEDLEHPDELRVDLDPVPGVPWGTILEVAAVARAVLEDHGLRGWPKTSGSRGVHVYVRIHPRWTFTEVRAAAVALAREVERRAPSIATSRWWKEERHGVFVDYNQNAKDRTTASAWSVRPTSDARVSTPMGWDELAACRPEDFTLRTVPGRFAERGDPWAGMDDAPGGLEALLGLAARQRAEGQGDAPWPPHYAKAEGEAPRVAPSRRRKAAPPHPSLSPRAARGEGDAARAASPSVGEGPARGEGDDARATSPSVAGRSARGEGDAPSPTGRRRSTKPLVVVARAARREDALAGLDRWKARHPEAAARLAPEDVLVDAMRGRFTTWTRVRVNLEHVPPDARPAAEPPDPDFDRGKWDPRA